jgi:hypothetical protein
MRFWLGREQREIYAGPLDERDAVAWQDAAREYLVAVVGILEYEAMVLVPKGGPQPTCDDPPQNARRDGARREEMSKSREHADRCRHPGDTSRDAAIKRGLHADMVHQRGSQSPVERDQGRPAAQLIQGPGALPTEIDDVNGEALARDLFQARRSWHGHVHVEASFP